MSAIEVMLPLKLVSEANGSHGHWAAKARRVKAQRLAVATLVRRPLRRVALPCTVTITRIAPRAFDDDNLVRSAKAVRDQIAAELGINDRDPRVTWRVEQRKGGVRQYGCEVRIEWSVGMESSLSPRPTSEAGSGIDGGAENETHATEVRG